MVTDEYKYPSQEYAEMRESGIYLLLEVDGEQLYGCHICGSVISKWRTHVLSHGVQADNDTKSPYGIEDMYD